MKQNTFEELLTNIRQGGRPMVDEHLTLPQLRLVKKALKNRKNDIDQYYDYVSRSRRKFKALP